MMIRVDKGGGNGAGIRHNGISQVNPSRKPTQKRIHVNLAI
jgi:hypothetical protein